MHGIAWERSEKPRANPRGLEQSIENRVRRADDKRMSTMRRNLHEGLRVDQAKEHFAEAATGPLGRHRQLGELAKRSRIMVANCKTHGRNVRILELAVAFDVGVPQIDAACRHELTSDPSHEVTMGEALHLGVEIEVLMRKCHAVAEAVDARDEGLAEALILCPARKAYAQRLSNHGAPRSVPSD